TKFEAESIRIHIVIRTVKQAHAYILCRVICLNAAFHRFTEALLNRGNIFPWNITPNNLIDKLKAGAYSNLLLVFLILCKLFYRADFKLHIGKFTATTGLLFVCFTMGNL